MKSPDERRIIHVIIATGVSSVVTQLVTVREFLAQFQGNEIVIALILFNWLVLGGTGTLLARVAARSRAQPTLAALAWLSMLLAVLPTLQIFFIRWARDVFFIHGASVGFYPTLIFTFATITPYSLLDGFVLPYSLFVLRTETPDYPGARVYISDNAGDVAGGALFSFLLVFLVSPLQAIALANIPLLVTACRLFPPARRSASLAAAGLAAAVLGGGILLESRSMQPPEGRLVYYKESRYGRLTVQQADGQFTLFSDGIPLFSSQNRSLAEESVHYALAQPPELKRVLVISTQGGMFAEIAKYRPEGVDYVELNPDVSEVLLRFDLIAPIEGLSLIHEDGRAFLARTANRYDAIVLNLPEPDTFQINRFYTDRFFSLARGRLTPGGVLAFSMEGYDNYLAEPQRRKLSSIYNTAAGIFANVVLIPGERVFFLCSDGPIATDIPRELARRGISTVYIRHYYDGNVTPERIESLDRLIDPRTPRNTDQTPYLMRLMFDQWFAKFAASPLAFIIVLLLAGGVYMTRISREEFVLFSTGCLTMGSEILVIFAFQVFYGYVYTQIGLIVTVFLAGLMPGAWYGDRLRRWGRTLLIATDLFLIVMLAAFIAAVGLAGDHLPVVFYLGFGFLISLACGCQFPVALELGGGDNRAATRTFSADLMGAAFGTLFTSLVLVTYFGIMWAAVGLIGFKLVSLGIIGSFHAQVEPQKLSL